MLRRPEDSLEADIEELEPEPGQHQHQHHGRKGESKPRRKVYHITVLREQSAENKTNKNHQVKEDEKETLELVDDTVHLITKLPLPNEYQYLLAHLSDQNQVGSGSSQRGSASNACSIADRQQETFTHPLPLLLYITQLLLLCVFHRYDHCDIQSVQINPVS